MTILTETDIWILLFIALAFFTGLSLGVMVMATLEVASRADDAADRDVVDARQLQPLYGPARVDGGESA